MSFQNLKYVPEEGATPGQHRSWRGHGPIDPGAHVGPEPQICLGREQEAGCRSTWHSRQLMLGA